LEPANENSHKEQSRSQDIEKEETVMRIQANHMKTSWGKKQNQWATYVMPQQPTPGRDRKV